MKRYRITYKGKDGQQIMTLLAKDKDDAQRQAERAQYRRLDRFPLTFDRLEQAHAAGTLTPEQFKSEMERRKRDSARYDGDLKIVNVEEMKS